MKKNGKEEFKKELEKQKAYNENEKKKIQEIKRQPKSFKRFWDIVIFYTLKPIYWLKENIKDWRTAIMFVVSAILVSSSVWGFYLAGIICGVTTDTAKWLFGIGSAVWIWWLGGASPFMLICIFLTIFLKGCLNKVRYRKYFKKEGKNV